MSYQPVNQWQAQQPVGLNYFNQGDSRRSMTFVQRFDIWKILFEPFVTREQGRYSKDNEGNDIDIPFNEAGNNGAGSVMLGVRKMAISGFLELSASYLLVLTTVGTAAGLFASGANIGLIALIVGAVHALGRYASVAARYTPHLPRHLDPAFTWYSWWRGDVGAVILLIYQVCQYGGALLATVTLNNANLHYRDYFQGASKFGGGADISLFAYFAYYTAALVIIQFVHGFAQTFTSHRFSYAKRFVHGAQLQAAAIFVLTQFTIHVGIFSNNPLILTGGIVGGGTSTAVTGSAMDWVIPILLAPLASGPIGAFFVWLLWNVNALRASEMAAGYSKDILREAGGNGGAEHTVAGRREEMPAASAMQGSVVNWIMQNDPYKHE